MNDFVSGRYELSNENFNPRHSPNLQVIGQKELQPRQATVIVLVCLSWLDDKTLLLKTQVISVKVNLAGNAFLPR